MKPSSVCGTGLSVDRLREVGETSSMFSEEMFLVSFSMLKVVVLERRSRKG